MSDERVYGPVPIGKFACPQGRGYMNSNAGLAPDKSGLTLEEERQVPLAVLKIKIATRGLDILPQEAVPDEALQVICAMAQEGYLEERSQIVTKENRQRLHLASLEARCGNLSRADKQVLKGLRALRRKGLI